MKLPTNNKLWLLVVLLVPASLTIALRSREAVPDILKPSTARASALTSLPPVMLWAWERPEKLDFLDAEKAGVAFLAKTIYLRGENVVSKPRLQPLSAAAGTKLAAVVRIESDRRDHPHLSGEQVSRAAGEIAELAKLPNVRLVQIDFDALVSERDFYRQLLFAVRQELPGTIPLSITALASWCDGDNWLSDLPVDEVVPMFFRLGVERRQFASRLASGEELRSSLCRNTAGISTDEPISIKRVQRLYVFNPKPWSQDSVNTAMEALRK